MSPRVGPRRAALEAPPQLGIPVRLPERWPALASPRGVGHIFLHGSKAREVGAGVDCQEVLEAHCRARHLQRRLRLLGVEGSGVCRCGGKTVIFWRGTP